MRQALDGALAAFGRLLWHLRLAGLVRRFGRRRPKILLYHACEPVESAPIRGLDVNCQPSVFAAQLDHLQRHYRVVSLADVESGSPPPGAVLVTFDDGYRSVGRYAAPLLAARGLPAVVYLITGVVGNDDVVWVNELNWLLATHPDESLPLAAAALDLPPEATASEVVAEAVGRYEPALVEDLLREIWEQVGGRAELLATLDLYLSWDEVRALAAQGFAFGSHTVTHPDLRRVDPERLRREVDESIAAIEREVGACTSFAYPFGFTDAEVMAVVEARPLASVVMVGSAHATRPPRRLTRVSLTSASDAQMFAELEVVEPAKQAIRAATRRLRRGGVDPVDGAAA